MTKFTLDTLDAIIAGRAGDAPDQSYTASLLSQGKEKCAKKFGEEAVEAVIASASGGRDELVQEAADVLYHLLVMLKAGDVTLEDVMLELDRRTAQSGLEEKSSRKKG